MYWLVSYLDFRGTAVRVCVEKMTTHVDLEQTLTNMWDFSDMILKFADGYRSL